MITQHHVTFTKRHAVDRRILMSANVAFRRPDDLCFNPEFDFDFVGYQESNIELTLYFVNDEQAVEFKLKYC